MIRKKGMLNIWLGDGANRGFDHPVRDGAVDPVLSETAGARDKCKFV
jgi:hypothetical protein